MVAFDALVPLLKNHRNQFYSPARKCQKMNIKSPAAFDIIDNVFLGFLLNSLEDEGNYEKQQILIFS